MGCSSMSCVPIGHDAGRAGRNVRMADAAAPAATRSSTSAATCCGSTPPTPATCAPARASGPPPSTWPAKLDEVGIAVRDPRVGARPGQPGRPRSRAPTRRAARCWCTATSTWCRPTPSEWSVHPFAGEISDGYLWGRGAIDMKDFDAMVLAVVRDWQRTGVRPPRDIVLAFTADEEAGGEYGAHFLVDNHADLLEGCTEAIGEVGGFSYTVTHDLRLYLVETAEKGIDWLRLHARGRPGHGSLVHDDNAVTALAEAVAAARPAPLPGGGHADRARVPGAGLRRARHRARPGRPGAGDRQARPDRQPDRRHRSATPPTRPGSRPATRTTSSPAGRRPPSTAAPCPARRRASSSSCATVIGPDIEIEHVQRAAGRRDHVRRRRWSTRWRPRCAPRTRARAPCRTCSPAAPTPRRSQRLGIRCFGFAPLRLPADLNFAALFHGIDERVPVDGLTFGVRVLDRFLRS